MDRYDADAAPDPQAWLDLDEDERLSRISRHHRGRVLRLHPKDFNLRLHAALHLAVENQIAGGEPPAAARAVSRLEASGLRRHVAVHMVVEVLMRTMTSGRDYDADGYTRDLDALDAGTWLGAKMQRDFGEPEG